MSLKKKHVISVSFLLMLLWILVLRPQLVHADLINGGYYTIRSKLDFNYGLGLGENDNVVLRRNPEGECLYNCCWRAFSLGGERYVFQNLSNGKYLDLDDSNRYNIFSFCLGRYTDNEIWQVYYKGDGYYRIAPIVDTFNTIDIFEGDITDLSDGTNIISFEWKNSDNQLFTFVETDYIVKNTRIELPEYKTIDDGTYYIKASLNPDWGATVSNNNVELGKISDDDYYKWNFTYLGDGLYSITNVGDGRYLDVTDYGQNTDVCVYRNGDPYYNELWYVVNNSGYWYLIPYFKPNMALDIDNGTMEYGTNIHLWDQNVGENQRFYLENVNTVYYNDITYDDGFWSFKNSVTDLISNMFGTIGVGGNTLSVVDENGHIVKTLDITDSIITLSEGGSIGDLSIPENGDGVIGSAMIPVGSGIGTDNVEIPLYEEYAVIVYDSNGGDNAPVPQYKTINNSLTLTTDIPSRDGYSFQGWSAARDGSVQYDPGEVYSGEDSVILYACWKPNTYTVNYDMYKYSDIPTVISSQIPSQTKEHDVDLTLSSVTPTQTGYTFLGWATSRFNALASVVEYMPGDTYAFNEDITLYASWKENTYAITYNPNGGSGAPVQQVKKYWKDLTLSKALPVRTGYDFQGWATSENGSVVYDPGDKYEENRNITLYAVWKSNADRIVYTIDTVEVIGGTIHIYGWVFDKTAQDSTLNLSIYSESHGGSFDIRQKIRSLETTGHRPDVNSAYGIDGLHGFDIYQDISPDGDYLIELYASYADGTGDKLIYSGEHTFTSAFTVTYDANGGVDAPASQTKQYGIDLRLSDDMPSYNGYTFQGWAKEKNGSVTYVPGATYLENSSAVFYAVWKENVYNIIYETNGGSDGPENQIKLWNQDLTLSSIIPKREGYAFKGWSTTSTGNVEYTGGVVYSANEDMTLYAVWEHTVTYTVSFNANGGSDAPGVQIKTKGIALTLSSDVPVREGYTFQGWATSSTGVVSYKPGFFYQEDASVELFAVWKLIGVPVDNFSLKEQTITVFMGSTGIIETIFEPVNATVQAVSWSSLNTNVFTVDADGVIHPVSPGRTLVKAVCESNGQTAYARVIVKNRETLTLPDELTRIEEEAFAGDTSIEAVKIGNKVRHIGSHAFKDCINLKELWIPATVTDIADNAFDGCNDLFIHCAEGSAAWEIALLKGFSYAIDVS